MGTQACLIHQSKTSLITQGNRGRNFFFYHVCTVLSPQKKCLYCIVPGKLFCRIFHSFCTLFVHFLPTAAPCSWSNLIKSSINQAVIYVPQIAVVDKDNSVVKPFVLICPYKMHSEDYIFHDIRICFYKLVSNILQQIVTVGLHFVEFKAKTTVSTNVVVAT